MRPFSLFLFGQAQQNRNHPSLNVGLLVLGLESVLKNPNLLTTSVPHSSNPALQMSFYFFKLGAKVRINLARPNKIKNTSKLNN